MLLTNRPNFSGQHQRKFEIPFGKVCAEGHGSWSQQWVSGWSYLCRIKVRNWQVCTRHTIFLGCLNFHKKCGFYTCQDIKRVQRNQLHRNDADDSPFIAICRSFFYWLLLSLVITCYAEWERDGQFTALHVLVNGRKRLWSYKRYRLNSHSVTTVVCTCRGRGWRDTGVLPDLRRWWICA